MDPPEDDPLCKHPCSSRSSSAADIPDHDIIPLERTSRTILQTSRPLAIRVLGQPDDPEQALLEQGIFYSRHRARVGTSSAFFATTATIREEDDPEAGICANVSLRVHFPPSHPRVEKKKVPKKTE